MNDIAAGEPTPTHPFGDGAIRGSCDVARVDRITPRVLSVLLGCALIVAGCTSASPSTSPTTDAPTTDAPAITVSRPPDVTLPASTTAALSASIGDLRKGGVTAGTAAALAKSRDKRIGWPISDLLRFSDPSASQPLIDAFHSLFANEPDAQSADDWQTITNVLIGNDVAAPPRYRGFKAELFLMTERKWEGIFTDFDADIDWRFLSWGGVLMDRRPLGDKDPCDTGCIPANDDPPVMSAAEGNWYPDDAIVFGVTVNGESLALPKNMMEVHEMMNLTLGGRRLGIPYCTLCGSAEAFYTDRVVGAKRPLVLRTSGLLYLSNKVMFDLDSNSAFDTFNGRAVSGDLHLDNVSLPMETIVTSTWGKWKQAHPSTKIIAKDGGWGRPYPADPLNGRDDNGPIFPIRQDDQRLSVQTQVLGVTNSSGQALAFAIDDVRAAIDGGNPVEFEGVSVTADAGGFVATENGTRLASHQAFWFAWAQFKPGTKLWKPK